MHEPDRKLVIVILLIAVAALLVNFFSNKESEEPQEFKITNFEEATTAVLETRQANRNDIVGLLIILQKAGIVDLTIENGEVTNINVKPVVTSVGE